MTAGLPVTEKSAVLTLTGKKPALNPVLTAASPVTEVSRLQRIASDKSGEEEVFTEKLLQPTGYRAYHPGAGFCNLY